MSQISYKILESLRKRNGHIRGIAKQLDINQMTVSRKMKELEEDNIIDHKIEGKNKVYSLKDTIEAKERLKMLEHYKLIRIISENSTIRNITQHIQANDNIQLAILFGSYAKNTQTKNSDIDIYIETKDKSIKKEIELINSKVSAKIGDFAMALPLAKEIISDHIILKGVDRYDELIHPTIDQRGQD